MKFKLFSLFAGAMLLFAGNAAAVTYSDSFVTNTRVDSNNPYAGTFTLVGYTAGSGLDSAFASFSFEDTVGNENISVTLGSTTYNIGIIPDLIIPFVYTIPALAPADLATLAATGSLNYAITAGGAGAAFVVSGSLLAEVPDGGSTVALLGLGMIGLAGASKKLRAKK